MQVKVIHSGCGKLFGDSEALGFGHSRNEIYFIIYEMKAQGITITRCNRVDTSQQLTTTTNKKPTLSVSKSGLLCIGWEWFGGAELIPNVSNIFPCIRQRQESFIINRGNVNSTVFVHMETANDIQFISEHLS